MRVCLCEQATATIASLSLDDKELLEELGANWCEQLQLEEGFIHSVYHHLLYTLQIVWDNLQLLMEDVADEIAETRSAWKVRGGVFRGRQDRASDNWVW